MHVSTSAARWTARSTPRISIRRAAYLNPPGLSGSASRAALSAQANFYPSGWRSREMLSYDLAHPLATRVRDDEHAVLSRAGGLERDRFLDRTGVRYRILPRTQAGGRTPIVKVPYLMDSFLFDYGDGVAPRVMVVSTAEVIGDIGQQIESSSPAGGTFAPRRSSNISLPRRAMPDRRRAVGDDHADAANRVGVQAGVGEAGGYLVLLDSFSDDWRATVDGRPATIVRANGLFRAVRLNPGPHAVEFLYRPRAFLVGAAASAAALAVVLALLAWPALPKMRAAVTRM